MTNRDGLRAGRDTGSTTGVATAVLALLSAGTLATLGMVTAGELRELAPDRAPARQQAAVAVARRRPGHRAPGLAASGDGSTGAEAGTRHRGPQSPPRRPGRPCRRRRDWAAPLRLAEPDAAAGVRLRDPATGTGDRP